MKWFIPREHGAWAMLIVPYLLGMFASKVTFAQVIFFIGVLAFYFASAPVLTFIRQPKYKKEILPSLTVYSLIGITFTIPILLKYPFVMMIGLCILPFFLLNLYFAKQKKERLFINDLIAILGLSLLVIIAYYLGIQTVDVKAILLMGINFIFFIASVFHVKTLIRERGNQRFLLISNIFHGLSIVIMFVIGLPIIALAFFIGACKAWFMPKNKRYKPVQIGLIEIANSVAFVLMTVFFY